MPRCTLVLAAVGALMLVTAAPAAAQDRDCSDFDSQAEAQDFRENAGPGRRGRRGEPRKPKRAQTIRSKVARVIDGDTLVIRSLDETARLDTPPIAGDRLAREETERVWRDPRDENLRRLAPRGRRLLLRTDPPSRSSIGSTACSPTPAYGRQLKSQITRAWAKVLVVRRGPTPHDHERRCRR